MKKILLIVAILSISAFSQNNKVRTDGVSNFVKARVDTGNCLIQSGDSRCVMSLADGYVKIQQMKDGNIKDTSDVVLYLAQGVPFPACFIRKVYSKYNGTDSCQSKVYVNDTLRTGVLIGR